MNLRLILILCAAGLAFTGAMYLKGRGDGREKYHQQQVKKTNDIKRKHAKVKRDAPGDSDKPAAIEWLRQRTRK